MHPFLAQARWFFYIFFYRILIVYRSVTSQDVDPDYYKRFLATINNPYTLDYKPTTIKDLSKTPAGSDDSYDEEEGDSCFARLMGTFEENGKWVLILAHFFRLVSFDEG